VGCVERLKLPVFVSGQALPKPGDAIPIVYLARVGELEFQGRCRTCNDLVVVRGPGVHKFDQ